MEPFVFEAAALVAEAEGTTVSQFVNRVVLERLSATDPAAYFAVRARRARPGAIREFLNRASDEPPVPGDEILDERAERA